MRADVPELLFPSRADFRAWLRENAETSGGVWLVFGKIKAVVTVTAAQALEEALCFGWIDGQMQSVNSTKYRKYFAKRRPKSVWSVKNKGTVEALREKGLMTELGEKAIEIAKENGTWDERTAESEQARVDAFAAMLAGMSPAQENFMKLPPSGKLAKMRWYHAFKSEDKQRQAFEDIVSELNKM